MDGGHGILPRAPASVVSQLVPHYIWLIVWGLALRVAASTCAWACMLPRRFLNCSADSWNDGMMEYSISSGQLVRSHIFGCRDLYRSETLMISERALELCGSRVAHTCRQHPGCAFCWQPWPDVIVTGDSYLRTRSTRRIRNMYEFIDQTFHSNFDSKAERTRWILMQCV